jgi:hypothetical protein
MFIGPFYNSSNYYYYYYFNNQSQWENKRGGEH